MTKEQVNEIIKDQNIFPNVIGYEDVKKELKVIRDCYLKKLSGDYEELSLTKGILLHGKTGCGKSLLAGEFAKMFNAPIFSIDGASEDGKSKNRYVSDIFKKAKGEDFAIILIDELDLLLDRDRNMVRLLQTELDGMDKYGNILVIATSNSLYDIPDPILRTGRIETLLNIDSPSTKTIKELFKFYFEKMKIDYSNLNLDYIAEFSNKHTVCSDVKAICNDVKIRVGEKELTTEDVLESSDRITRHEIPRSYRKELFSENVAIHEIGHALMAYKSKNYNFYKSEFDKESNGGCTKTYSNSNGSIEKALEDIRILLGGYAAERLFKIKSVGSSTDLGKARNKIAVLINKDCYYNITDIMQPFNRDARLETYGARKNFERKIKRVIHKEYKYVYKTLKQHKDAIILLKDKMLERGYIYRNDIFETMLMESRSWVNHACLNGKINKPISKVK